MTTRRSVSSARNALSKHDQAEASRRASADTRRGVLANAVASAERAEANAERAALLKTYAAHCETVADSFARDIAIHNSAIEAIKAKLIRLNSQAEELATTVFAANAEIERLLVDGDVAAATEAVSRARSAEGALTLVRARVAAAQQGQKAIIDGTGDNDSLSDLRREFENATVAAQNARAEACRVIADEDDPTSPGVQSTPELLDPITRIRLAHDLDRARSAAGIVVIHDAR
jgi:hypothetical protein